MANNKDISYKGYTAQPSDYECQDGELAMSLNLINENGYISAIEKPVKLLDLSEGEKVLFVHSTPGQKNFILSRQVNSSTIGVYWLKKDDDNKDTSQALHITNIDLLRDITALGNTLICATENGLIYLLWKDDGYKILGSKPPFISIDFGLDPVNTLAKTETFSVPEACLPLQNGASSVVRIPTKEELAEVTQTVYGFLNPAIADTITSKGFFYQPFFIRFAFKLYDGSYSWQSVPILMLPTVIPPIIKLERASNNSASLTLNVPYFALAYRILSDGVAALSDWSDLITGIDIFVSAPIYTYDQSKDLNLFHTTLRSMLLSACCKQREDNRSGSTTTPSSVFVGHYKERSSGRYIDHAMSTAGSDSYTIVNIQQHENFRDNIRSAHNFYRLAEIPIKDIKAMNDMKALKLSTSELSNIVTRETLPDDYQSHSTVIASSLYSFNSRLNLADVTLIPAKPFPIRSCTELSNPEGSETKDVIITVWTRLNGTKCKAIYTATDKQADIIFNFPSNFPRYIYYPDASAYKMQIQANGTKYIIDLTSHEFLNGSYWFNDEFLISPNIINTESENEDCPLSVNLSSKIYTSEVNNPFLFPVTGINTIGSGRVMKLSSAVKALSQGQFGQFPLYAFTDEGVWALEVTSNGSYSAKQPITRDVCIAPSAITQIDSAVLFPTDRGIMLLSGSTTTCISDTISDETPFNILTLPGMSKLHAMLGHSEDTCLRLIPFNKFLSQSDMIYDYTHQRIIVYNPGCTYAYVFSLKTKLWCMMHSRILEGVNSYPNALAVTGENELVDYSEIHNKEMEAGSHSGIIVTRPLKLDAINILKTIDNVIQHGNFAKGHVQSALYGSRDLTNWHLVWSSKDHFLRGFRGSPYKYFRIALLCKLSPGESIYGASCQFTPRLVNQPR